MFLNEIKRKGENMNPKKIKPEISGIVEKPKLVMLPDGVDHLNWIEVGKKERMSTNSKIGYECCVVSYAPNFGHLWHSGRIDDENLEKAKLGKKFSWERSGISGHGCP